MKKRDLAKYAISTSIGTGVGVLFAPKIKNEIKHLFEKVKKLNSKKKEVKMNRKIKSLEKEIDNFDNKKILKKVQKKSELIKNKAIDLVDLACAKKNVKEVGKKTNNKM